MGWDERTGQSLGRTALFLKQLRTLESGQRLNLKRHEFQDMDFPFHPLDRPTWEDKAEWLRQRADFPCKLWQDAMSGDFIFERT